MYNNLFSIGPFTVHGYGLLIAIGVILAYFDVLNRVKKSGGDTSKLDSIAVWIFGFGFLGSKLLYWLTQLDVLFANPLQLFDLTSGYVVYGGIIGGLVGGYFYSKKEKISFLAYCDYIIPGVALAQGFGRIGCFLSGCCFGLESSGPLSVIFPVGSLAPSGVALFPIQLLCSGLDFIHYFILIFFIKKKQSDGQVGALYLILYSLGRFIIEFFRGDLIRGSVGQLSTSQFISIFMFVTGLFFFIRCYYKKKVN